MNKGVIIKALSGFYYVDNGENIIECRARGVFRKNSESPLVGDNVEFEQTTAGKGVVDKIINRKNALVRPPVANIDRLFIVASTADPAPNTFIIDRIIAIAENSEIEPIVIVNKCDLENGDEIFETYTKAGFITIAASATQNQGIEDIKALISSKICAFTGNSGVGKSSILNALNGDNAVATGDISKKLGRGRHTTRHVELYKTCGGYIADTPGFSSFDVERCDIIRKENLQFCFREFKPYISTCKFTSCTHTREKGCNIVDAVKNGTIAKSRHESYVKMYEEASKTADWEFDKNEKMRNNRSGENQ